ncbi:MAG TPA: glycosyltransferase [Candidatus Dormibacteraeota bacterium]|nr:glycosyltransferase [Candidatus Dormibacteraeota bacterium]
MIVPTLLGAAALFGWLAIALRPGRFWDLRPVLEERGLLPEPAAWPSVSVLVPARNERASLPLTLPALLAQDYPGPWRVVLVDDRSEDDTAPLARGLSAGRAMVVEGRPLPDGWAGKIWALEQAAAVAGRPDYLWLTDADIAHHSSVLRRLVAESEAAGLALNSVMARLHTASPAERLLVPPFLFFFNLLYPMRLVNGAGATAAAAGGCVLIRRDCLRRAGGFAAIRGEVIDDLSLARAVKRLGEPIRLSVSRAEVVSVRRYDSLGAFWRTVRRTAFAELRHSWTRLVATVLGLVLAFAVPPAVLVLGAAAHQAAPAVVGAAAWAVMAAIFVPTVRFFGLSPAWALTLPLAGLLYGAMTIDSALRHATGSRRVW